MCLSPITSLTSCVKRQVNFSFWKTRHRGSPHFLEVDEGHFVLCQHPPGTTELHNNGASTQSRRNEIVPHLQHFRSTEDGSSWLCKLQWWMSLSCLCKVTQNKPKDRLFSHERGAFMVGVYCGPRFKSLAKNVSCTQWNFVKKTNKLVNIWLWKSKAPWAETLVQQCLQAAAPEMHVPVIFIKIQRHQNQSGYLSSCK